MIKIITIKEMIQDLQKNGMNQLNIAKILGCDRSSVNKYLHDVYKTPTYLFYQRALDGYKKQMKKFKK